MSGPLIELRGLRVFAHHGVLEHERRDGQTFVLDVDLRCASAACETSDRLEDAVDYTEVAAAVRELSDARRFDLLEALAVATADLLYERFRPDRVRVRVRKPQARPGGMTVEHSAVTVERP